MPSRSQSLRPRLCALEKGDNGYGFHLHGEKGKTGQFIRLVEPDSPAETSGLRAGDRLVFVNGEDVETESHQQVVSRIRATTVGRLELVVVDPDTEQLLKKHGMKCLKEHVTDGIAIPFDEEEEEEVEGEEEGEEVVMVEEVVEDGEVDRTGDAELHAKKKKEEEEEEQAGGGGGGGDTQGVHAGPGEQRGDPRTRSPPRLDNEPGGRALPGVEEVSTERRPRLCVIQRGSNGYGFNLHSERARPGQYIRAVDEDSPAEKGRPAAQGQDNTVQNLLEQRAKFSCYVNGLSVEGKTHSEVVAAIKAGGGVTRLLVVDPDTDAFFKRCRVAPTSDHLTGPLPEPIINGGMEEKVNGRGAKEAERDSKLSVSPSPSNASSNASLTTPPTNTPPEGLVVEAIPALSLSLQQVKELAHQKRSNKRAPPMDWTKKNELFSNL
ncbi:hypothetical protein L3Q82_014339 [Scortum barcoo]|uniref:Uncharacterized protein n=1 Tax=Scortum barcoo TaxID=214431 RepID=A0ACB8VX57_9TELE|nr:hypothetical protein L3Q82_014339 [Scortum barcoo]